MNTYNIPVTCTRCLQEQIHTYRNNKPEVVIEFEHTCSHCNKTSTYHFYAEQYNKYHTAKVQPNIETTSGQNFDFHRLPTKHDEYPIHSLVQQTQVHLLAFQNIINLHQRLRGLEKRVLQLTTELNKLKKGN